MIELSYDGCGINDLRSEYAPRIATFVSADAGEHFGKLFAAAPDLLEALEITLNEAEDQCGQLDVDTLGILRDAIAKAGRIRP